MSIVFEVTSHYFPLQLEGAVNGKPFYFRARGNSIYCEVQQGEDGVDKPEKFVLNQTVASHEDDTSMTTSLEEALGFIQMAARLS
jgi:hypothetical protein